jgi:hypothetical protein
MPLRLRTGLYVDHCFGKGDVNARFLTAILAFAISTSFVAGETEAISDAIWILIDGWSSTTVEGVGDGDYGLGKLIDLKYIFFGGNIFSK